jgi:hypothetical protein
MVGHFPIHLSIAAAGAGMVSLIEHASDDHTPAVTAWILSGSVALALVSLIGVMRTLRDFERLSAIYRPLTVSMLLAAAAALATGAWGPPPALMAGTLLVVMAAVWWFAVSRWLGMEDPSVIQAGEA